MKFIPLYHLETELRTWSPSEWYFPSCLRKKKKKRNKGPFKKTFIIRESGTEVAFYALKNDATSGLTNFIHGDLISSRQDALHGDIRVSSL